MKRFTYVIEKRAANAYAINELHWDRLEKKYMTWNTGIAIVTRRSWAERMVKGLEDTAPELAP